MALTQSKFITVAISANSVSAAQVSRAGFVEKLVRQPVVDDNTAEALKAAMAGFVLKGAAVICVMPGDVATTKHLEVPSTDAAEIESIIALQASRHTPFSREEIITGYVKISSPRPNFTKVLLVVVKKDAVKEKLAFLRGAGVDTTAVLFAPEGMARFYAQAVGPKKNEIFALLDVSRASANFMVVGMGAPLMSRAIPVGTAAMSADVSSRDRLVTEVKASIEAFTQETSLNVSRVILTQALEGVDVMITGAMGLLVEIFPYARRIKAAKAVQETLAKDFSDDSALDIIAAGCTAVACGADLVPQEIRDQRAVAEKGRETLKAAVLVLLLLLAIGGGLLSRVYFKDVFLRQNLREKYADQKKEVGVLESMITKTAIVRDYLKVRSLPLEAIRELYTIIPEEIYLSSVSMDDGGAVSIQGVSASMSRVFSVVTALEDSPLFENVKTKSTTAKKEAGKDVAAFEIVLKLSSVNEERAAADVKPGPQGASLDQ